MGSDHTIITIDGAINAVDLTTTASRVSGFRFIIAAGDFAISARGHHFRIDHNVFDNQTSSANRYAVYVSGGTGIPHPTGLVDHNTFLNSRVVTHGTRSLFAAQIWSEPLRLGAAGDGTGVVYIEDNVFSRTVFADAVDGEYGARYVFRYNAVTNGQCEIHSIQGPSGSHTRGARSWEIYENTFNFTLGNRDTACFIRSGTGVFFSNRITGMPPNFPIKLDNVRSFAALSTPPGSCDGTASYDGNLDRGWPCRDQIGRSTDLYVSTTDHLAPQDHEPAYFWGNTLNGTPIHPIVANCAATVKLGGSCADIIGGRDYVSSVSTSKPQYTPFTYPHPLALRPWPPLSPPSQLTITQ
jgi:hypothetical protein